MFCTGCGAQRPGDSRFCPACGKSLAAGSPGFAVCAGCGNELRPGKAFCGTCGVPAPAVLTAPDGPDSLAAPGGTATSFPAAAPVPAAGALGDSFPASPQASPAPAAAGGEAARQPETGSTPAPPASGDVQWAAPRYGVPPADPVPAGPGLLPSPGGHRTWAAAVTAVLLLVLLGGVLPAFSESSAKIIDSGSGALYTAGICLLLAVLTVDVLIGSEVALAIAAGVGTMVVSVAAIVGAVTFELRSVLHPSAGAVFLLLAALPTIAVIGAGVARTGRRHSRMVHPAVAAAVAVGAAISAVGLIIPPVPHESIGSYLFGSHLSVLGFGLLLPVILTVGCGALTAVARTAASVAVTVGSAAGLLVVWGADEVTRSQSGQSVVAFLDGAWLVVLVGLVVALAAGVWALAAPAPGPLAAKGTLLRRVGVAPLLAAATAVVIVPVAVSHHSAPASTSPYSIAYASPDSTSTAGGYNGNSSGSYSGTGGSYDTTPPTSYTSPDTSADTSPPDSTYTPSPTSPRHPDRRVADMAERPEPLRAAAHQPGAAVEPHPHLPGDRHHPPVVRSDHRLHPARHHPGERKRCRRRWLHQRRRPHSHRLLQGARPADHGTVRHRFGMGAGHLERQDRIRDR
jgi:hypothetical protein